MLAISTCARAAPSVPARNYRLSPLSVPLANTPTPTGATAKSAPTLNAERTVLENGVSVVSVDREQPGAHVAIVVRAGSRNETPANNGCAHFLKAMAFRSTEELSALRLVRDLEQFGANATVSASRELISYAASFVRNHARSVVPTLAQVVRPALQEWEMRDSREIVERESAAFNANPQTALLDALHREAFRNSGLALPGACPSWNLHSLTEEDLLAFVSNYYTGPRMALVGVNVPHAELVELANNSGIAEVPETSSSAVSSDAPQFHSGAEVRVPAGGDLHFAVAFQAPSRTAGKDYAAGLLLQALLNGRALLSGRQYTGALARALSGVECVQHSSAFLQTYSNAGLFGVYVRAAAGHGAQTVSATRDAIASTLQKISDEDFRRAGTMVSVDVASQTDCRMHTAALLAESTLLDTATADSLVSQVSLADVQRVASTMLASKPVVAAVGDVHALPRY